MTKSFPLICIILLLFVVIFLLFNTKFMNENNEKISLTANLDKIINKNIEKIRERHSFRRYFSLIKSKKSIKNTPSLQNDIR